MIASLSRAVPGDIDAAWEALKDAERPRIHTFLSSSEIHMLHQMRKDREEIMGMAIDAVRRAKSYCEDVEFSPMDATRTDPQYLYDMVEAVIEAGATTVNIPDTVGYSTPEEFGAVRGTQWPEPAIQRFLLYGVFLRELGHLQVIDEKAKSTRKKYAREGKAQEFAMYWCRALWREPFDHPDPVHNKPSQQEIAEVKARLGVQG